MTPEEHRTLREMLGAFSLGHLPDEEQTRVRAHLDGCADCRRDLAEIAPLAQSLRFVDIESVSRVESPDPALGERVLAAVDVERRSARRASQRRRVLLAAAAVLAVVAVGGVGAFIGGKAVAPEAAPVPVETVEVTSRASAVEASAGLVAHTWGVEIKLEAVGFEPGAAYSVVLTTDSGSSRSAGGFVGTGAQTMNCNLNSDVLREDASGFEILDESGRTVLSADL